MLLLLSIIWLILLPSELLCNCYTITLQCFTFIDISIVLLIVTIYVTTNFGNILPRKFYLTEILWAKCQCVNNVMNLYSSTASCGDKMGSLLDVNSEHQDGNITMIQQYLRNNWDWQLYCPGKVTISSPPHHNDYLVFAQTYLII